MVVLVYLPVSHYISKTRNLVIRNYSLLIEDKPTFTLTDVDIFLKRFSF